MRPRSIRMGSKENRNYSAILVYIDHREAGVICDRYRNPSRYNVIHTNHQGNFGHKNRQCSLARSVIRCNFHRTWFRNILRHTIHLCKKHHKILTCNHLRI